MDRGNALRDPFVEKGVQIEIVLFGGLFLKNGTDALKIRPGQHTDPGAYRADGDGDDHNNEDNPPAFFHTATSL